MALSLCLQVTISLKEEDDDPEKCQYTEHFYAGGLSEYVSWLNTDKVRISTLESRAYQNHYLIRLTLHD